jgi:hypothetical protein
LGEFDLGLIAFEPDQVEKFVGDLGLNGRTDPGGVPEVPNQPAGSSPVLNDDRASWRETPAYIWCRELCGRSPGRSRGVRV